MQDDDSVENDLENKNYSFSLCLSFKELFCLKDAVIEFDVLDLKVPNLVSRREYTLVSVKPPGKLILLFHFIYARNKERKSTLVASENYRVVSPKTTHQ